MSAKAWVSSNRPVNGFQPKNLLPLLEDELRGSTFYALNIKDNGPYYLPELMRDAAMTACFAADGYRCRTFLSIRKTNNYSL